MEVPWTLLLAGGFAAIGALVMQIVLCTHRKSLPGLILPVVFALPSALYFYLTYVADFSLTAFGQTVPPPCQRLIYVASNYSVFIWVALVCLFLFIKTLQWSQEARANRRAAQQARRAPQTPQTAATK